MPTKRTYGEGCVAAHALDVVGERWALLVVRELILGPKRFTDLRAGMPGCSPNVLSERLRELEAVGVVRRRTLAPPAASKVYELTEWGAELAPVIDALGRFGSRSPMLPVAAMSVDATILSLRTMFDSQAAEGVDATYELRLGEDRFCAAIAKGSLEIARGEAERPDATITTDHATLAALVYGGRRLAEAQRAGAVGIEGDKAAVKQFLGSFEQPQPVALPA